MSFSSIGLTIKEELFPIKSILSFLLISALYFFISVLILNYNLVSSSIFGNFSLSYKASILTSLIEGSWTAFSHIDFFLLVITSLLVGLNGIMIMKTVMLLENKKNKLSFTVGGSALIGVAVAGCSSCGFSVLSLIGLSASLSLIPFGALGLHLIVIALLMFSFMYSLNSLSAGKSCEI